MAYVCSAANRWQSRSRAGIPRVVAAAALAAALATTHGTAQAQPPQTDPQTEPAPGEATPEGRTVPQAAAPSGPRVISDWDDGDPIPPGYHAKTRARKGLVIGGAVTFGTMYLITVLVAAAATDVNQNNQYTRNADAALFIPGVGPFIQMAHTGNDQSENVVLAIDGVAQSAAIAMFIYGIASSKTVLVRDDVGRGDAKPFLRATPILLGRGTTGFGVVGSF